MMADPEDGGYATTDEELDSDNEDADVELDLKMWLNQLDSPTTITKNPSTLKTKSSADVTSNTKTTKLEQQFDVDFDSILGELNSLDEQFNDVQPFDSSSHSTSSKPIPPAKRNDPRPPEKPKFTKTPQTNEVKISDDFGDINAQLQDAILELNKLVDDGTSTTKKGAAEPTATVHTQRVSASAEMGPRHGASGRTDGPQHPQQQKHLTIAGHSTIHTQRVGATENGEQRGATGSIQGAHHPQREKHPVENERCVGKKPAVDTPVRVPVPHSSVPGGRKSWREEGGSREDAVSVKSSDSRSSSNSLNQSAKSLQSSVRSVVSETMPHQVCVKVFAPDGSSKSVLVDESMTVGHLCKILIEKNLADRNLTWGVVEQMPDLFMQRMLEDHQLVVEEIRGWSTQTSNRLFFLETPRKYDTFDKSRVLDEGAWQATELEGYLHLKSEGKKAWKKQGFVIRNGGIYHASKGKGKSEPPCLKLLSEVEVFTGVAWKKKFKAPTDFGIALKPGFLQKKSVQDIKYLCADDSALMWKWVTAIRLAKHGFQLYRNFCQYVLANDDGSAPPSETTRTADAAAHCHNSNLISTAHQRVSDADIEQPTTPSYEMQRDCQMNTLRRGSADRGGLVSNQDQQMITSKIKAQIPITAQTARLLSMQPSSMVQTLPRTISRGGTTESPKQPQNGHQRQPSVTFNETMSQLRTGLDNHPGFRVPSPNFPLPPPPSELSPRQPLNGHQRIPSRPFNERSGFDDHPGYRSPSPDLPPPPPEFLESQQNLSPPVPYSTATLKSPTRGKTEPPPPPRRNQGTKLSFHGRTSNVVQTKNFILNLSRAIGQKQHHGAEGICQLEMPLPPPPVYSDDPSYLDLGELPPPPAELLEELKVMKRKSKQPPPTLAKNSTLRSTKLR